MQCIDACSGKRELAGEAVTTMAEVLRSLDGHGKVVSQSSRGEDLAEPIQDGERKMAVSASKKH
jgi:hypothetical protein